MPSNPTSPRARQISRRAFLFAGLAGVAVAATKAFAAPINVHPVRPPGSLPEEEFLQACIRCGECFQACPNDVLQPTEFEHGLAGLWTPHVNANWAGCESSCNNCGQVCPTGAIRALPMEEKRVARMGLAKVEPICLPLAGKEACQLCVDECNAAGYHAIEFMRVHPKLDETGLPIDGSGFSAPVVLADKCVGCGLCQTRCHSINVKTKHLPEIPSGIFLLSG
jgi:NAD-dependent dihydropyrimidine dehydrogenase PreA subunit